MGCRFSPVVALCCCNNMLLGCRLYGDLRHRVGRLLFVLRCVSVVLPPGLHGPLLRVLCYLYSSTVHCEVLFAWWGVCYITWLDVTATINNLRVGMIEDKCSLLFWPALHICVSCNESLLYVFFVVIATPQQIMMILQKDFELVIWMRLLMYVRTTTSSHPPINELLTLVGYYTM